ncbi:hypothetical protein [Nonomuraea salmonea]|uniref:hypothetical protein n=1 Tax=Nonomuraea salmonea TaxID=46181 RepID=UPI002FE98EC6
MRPQLRDDVRFVECPDGAYVHSDYGACTLRGRQAYAWLTRLAPALTGHHTLGELTANLSGDRKAMVERLVGQLAEWRFVVDARQAGAHGLSEMELGGRTRRRSPSSATRSTRRRSASNGSGARGWRWWVRGRCWRRWRRRVWGRDGGTSQ